MTQNIGKQRNIICTNKYIYKGTTKNAKNTHTSPNNMNTPE